MAYSDADERNDNSGRVWPTMSEADGMREKIAQAVQDHFSDGGGCVDGHDWSGDREEAARQSTAAADAILRLVSLGEPVAWRWKWVGESETGEGWTYREMPMRPDIPTYRYICQPLYAPPSTQEASQ